MLYYALHAGDFPRFPAPIRPKQEKFATLGGYGHVCCLSPPDAHRRDDLRLSLEKHTAVQPAADDDPGAGTITPDPDKETIYDPEEVIKAFNKATNFADASKIYFLVDGKQVILTTLLKSLDSSLVDMQTVVTKVQNMEAIPLLDNKVEGAVPVVVENPDSLGNFIIKWTKLSYDQLDNLPNLNEIREW